MAKKASLRSGRCGSMIHNFDIRRDNIEGYDDRHINRDLSDINIYVYNNNVQADGVHLAKQEFSELLKDKAFSGDAHAREIYAELYQDGLETRNETYIKQGHKERCKSIDDWYNDDKYRARETIIQIGNHKDTTLDAEHIEDIKKVRDELQACIEQYALEYTEKYGSNYKVLNWTIHCDEIQNGSVHAHLQDTFFIKDKDGNFTPNQNKALEQMRVKLPNPEKKKSLHNSLIKSFTAEQRQRFTEICLEHGLEVELYDAAKITERNDSKTLHQNTVHLDAEIEEKQHELTQLQNNIAKKKEEVEKEEQALIKAHEDRDQEELELSIIKQKDIPEAEHQVQELKDEIDSLQKQSNSLASQLQEGVEVKDRLEKDRDKLTKEIADLKAEKSSVGYTDKIFKSIQAKFKPELEKAKLFSGQSKFSAFKKSEYKTQLGHKDVYLVPEFDLDNLLTYQYDHAKLRKDVQSMFSKVESFLKNAFKELTDSLTQREQAVSRKEAEIEPLHAEAKDLRDKAQDYLDNQKSYILGTAEDLADKKIAQLQANRPYQAPYEALLDAVDKLGVGDEVAELEKARLHKLFQADRKPSTELLSDLIGEAEANKFKVAEIRKSQNLSW